MILLLAFLENLTFDWTKIVELATSLGIGALLMKFLDWMLGKKKTDVEVEILSFDSLKQGFEELKNNLINRLDQAEAKVGVISAALEQAQSEYFKTRQLVLEQEIKIKVYEQKIIEYTTKISEYELIYKQQEAQILALRAQIANKQDNLIITPEIIPTV